MTMIMARTHFVNILPIYLILIIIPSIVFSLTCYQCQERRAGDWCLSPSKQKCDSAASICLKYLHKEGKSGFLNHVMAKCELRSEYVQNRINACERSVRKLADGGLTITEICTCDKDLCNDASLNVSKMIESGKGADDEEKPETTTTAAAEDEYSEAPAKEEDEHHDEYEDEEEESEDQAIEKPEPEEQHGDGSAESGEGNAAMRLTTNAPISRICTAIVAQVVFLFAILR